MTITITALCVDGLRLVFAPPVVLRQEVIDGVLMYSEPELGMHVLSGPYEEMIAGAKEDIAWLWRSYAAAEDSELSEDAIRLKRHLLEIGKEIS